MIVLFTERDGSLAIIEQKAGQFAYPRLYSGIKRKILEWIVKLIKTE